MSVLYFSIDLIMPETHIEPMTNRQECFKCHKTMTGKKKFPKCAGCHAITYCGQECAREDFARHKWNCVPVMVTEIPGKGRGLVAAKDIKIGELIFTDKPLIKFFTRRADADGCRGFPGSFDPQLYIRVTIFPEPSGTKPVVNMTKKPGKKEIDK